MIQHEAIDTAVKKYRRRITCPGSGCSSCCGNDVMAHPSEIEAIAAAMPVALREGVKEASRHPFEGRCPLLARDGSCTVYAARPSVCRAFHNKGGKPARCCVTERPETLPQIGAVFREAWSDDLSSFGHLAALLNAELEKQ
mgnify:CR=1 FL=1